MDREILKKVIKEVIDNQGLYTEEYGGCSGYEYELFDVDNNENFIDDIIYKYDLEVREKNINLVTK